MVKKDILLDKDNKHFYSGSVVYFATKHEKARVVAPLLSSLGISVKSVEIDTDQFGTFSGEIERQGSIKDTLKKKIQAAEQLYPEAKLFLASEGTFGPHPYLAVIQSNHEALLWVDKDRGIEIFAETLSTNTNQNEIEVKKENMSNVELFLAQVHFPSHAVIVKSKGSTACSKGITQTKKVYAALDECIAASPIETAIVMTDMRACFNPTRMTVIEDACKQLVEKLQSECPACAYIGFSAVESIGGLPCLECGMSTHLTRGTLWQCIHCSFGFVKQREDGVCKADPYDCEFCNP